MNCLHPSGHTHVVPDGRNATISASIADAAAVKRAACRRPVAAALGALFMVSLSGNAGEPAFLPNMLPFPNPAGLAATVSSTGSVDLTGPFFQSLGTNGRACVTCHQPSAGWTITPEHVQARFAETGGTDALFRTNDGSNCENADVDTLAARQTAFSLLLNRGLIRIALDVPPTAEFDIVSVDDPFSCAANFVSPLVTASLYRRPLPSTNLPFLTAIM